MQRVCKSCVILLKNLRESEIGSIIERTRLLSKSLVRIKKSEHGLDQESQLSNDYKSTSFSKSKIGWLTSFSTLE